MKDFYTLISRRAGGFYLSIFISSLLVLILTATSLQAQQGLVPVLVPQGGMAIDGNLLARTPDASPFTADMGDFLPNENAAGTGGSVFDASGMPLDTLTAFHILDGFDSADGSIFTEGSKFNMDPNDWVWMPGKPAAKTDINHAMFYFASDSLGNIWFVGSGDRKRAKGNTYLDYELLQAPVYMNSDSSFTSMGAHGGRTPGDLALTVEFVNGGIDPQLYVYVWDSTGPGTYDYVMVSPPAGTAFLSVNSDSAVVVPYGAFGETSYAVNSFTELACNINELVPGNYNCIDIKTVIAKTKASQSINAVLKDLVTPVQLAISSAPVISLDDQSICFGDTATLSVNIVSGSGPFTYAWSTGDTTQSIMVSPDTTTNYSVVVTGINGCPSDTAYTTLIVFPLPECSITGPDTLCPLGTAQYSAPDSLSAYLWTVYGPATIVGDSNLQTIMIEGTGYCDTTFILELMVTDSNACSSLCSVSVSMIDTLPPIFSSVPDSLFVACASDVPAASVDSVTVIDNCAGSLTLMVSDSIMNDTLCPNQFTMIRTWTAYDTCGNMASASQYISVFDSIPPLLYGVPADTGVCCADSIPPPANVTAIDSCDGAVDVTLAEIVSDSTSPFYFTLTRIWTAMDTCSNMVSDSMVIEVNDTLYPAGGGMVSIAAENRIVRYFTVSPNPFSHVTNIEFGLVKSAVVSLELYDYTGNRIKGLFSGKAEADEPVRVPLTPDANIQAGMYLLVLKTQYGISTRRIIMRK